MFNAEVSKTGNESPLSVIRKFSRRVQGTGLIQNARKRRYFARTTSKTVAKKRALKRIKRHNEFRRLVKEGKMPETPLRRGFHGRSQNTENRSNSSAPATPARLGGNAPIVG